MVASLAWSAVAGYAAWRADLWASVRERRLVRQLDDAKELVTAKADAETKAALKGRTVSNIVLPDDLEAVAMQESEGWARDNERQLMRERFLELAPTAKGESDAWQKVRRAVGIGELP